jgi:hypothetical protein
LGDLEIKAHGTLILLRARLYVILGSDGRVLRDARHGFHGSASDLLELIRRGGGTYTARHMIRPREAARLNEKPFRMISRQYRVHEVPPEVWDASAKYLREERFTNEHS